jgi:mannonate dehydratase
MLPGVLRAPPILPRSELSPAAVALLERCFEDVAARALLDCHVHVVGIGDGDTGCKVNPDMRSRLSPIRRIKYEAYLAASGLEENGNVDADYLARVQLQTDAFPEAARFAMLAFDWYHDAGGVARPERSTFYVPNDYVARICKKEPRWTFFASVHPYRPDALTELERVHALGATGIKWLPNAMGIDPLDRRCDAFYDKLRELQLVLLTHAGHELAVHGDDAQALGNPLRLRKPLEHGIKVVVAHCASYGSASDLDASPATERSAFELFLRLMGEACYEGQLFGGLSATTLRNREPNVMRTLLERADLHERLINGSDYPVIAVDPLISLSSFAGAGLLADDELPALRELFYANPMLWDFALKRRFRIVVGGRVRRFEPAVFEGGRLLRSV